MGSCRRAVGSWDREIVKLYVRREKRKEGRKGINE